MLPFRFFLPTTASDFSLQSVTTERLLPPSSFVFLVLDKNKLQHLKELVFLAVRTGLEPATPGVTGRYSNQLNYRTICSDFMRFCRTRMQRYAFFSNLQIFLSFFDKKSIKKLAASLS